jgi:predicted Zn finger-like uncharacterized protein
MSDQLTQCPHCQTSFRVTAGQLTSAGGLVRCGSCLGLFSAAINFIRVKPDPDDASPEDEDDDLESSDDILLGDLDLDSLPLMSEPLLVDDLDSSNEDDEESDEPEDILFSDRSVPHHAHPEAYELYEEYEEAPDLLVDLATPAVAASDDAEANAPFVLVADNEQTLTIEPNDSDGFADDAEGEWLGAPSEEFKPHTILFDDDEENDDAADEATDDPEPATADEMEFADGYQDEADLVPRDREISLEHGGPTLGELTADEFDSPDISEIELDELLLSDEVQDAAGDADASEYDDDEDDHDIDDQRDIAHDGRQQPGFGDDEADAADILDEYMEEMHADTRDFGGASDDIPALAPRTSKTSITAGSKPAWLQRQDQVTTEKAALHDYLATLEDEADLEPLAPDHLDEFDDEPVLLSGGHRKRGLLATTGLLLLSLLLIGTLLLQFVDQHLEALRQRNSFARFEPWFCAILECPPAAAPVTAGSSLYSQELLIRSHPRIKGALELSFIFRNDAAEPQRFPGLELSFQDPSNTLLANRLLLPTDYLPPELRPLAAMPGRSTVQIMLELIDPGAEAVNYSIGFRDL